MSDLYRENPDWGVSGDEGSQPRFVPVEPVGTLAVRHDETEDERYMLSAHFEPMRSGGLIIWTDLPPGNYLIVPVPKKPKEPGHRLIGTEPRRIVGADDE